MIRIVQREKQNQKRLNSGRRIIALAFARTRYSASFYFLFSRNNFLNYYTTFSKQRYYSFLLVLPANFIFPNKRVCFFFLFFFWLIFSKTYKFKARSFFSIIMFYSPFENEGSNKVNKVFGCVYFLFCFEQALFSAGEEETCPVLQCVLLLFFVILFYLACEQLLINRRVFACVCVCVFSKCHFI